MQMTHFCDISLSLQMSSSQERDVSPEESRTLKSLWRQSSDPLKNRVRVRSDNQTHWVFTLKDEEIFLHKLKKAKETKTFTVNGDDEPQKVVDVLLSKK